MKQRLLILMAVALAAVLVVAPGRTAPTVVAQGDLETTLETLLCVTNSNLQAALSALLGSGKFTFVDVQTGPGANGVDGGGDDVHTLTVTLTAGAHTSTHTVTYVDTNNNEVLNCGDDVTSVS